MKKSRPWLLWAALALLALAAAGSFWAWGRLTREKVPEIEVPDTRVLLARHDPDEVEEIRTVLRSGETWTAVQTSPGILRFAGEGGHALDSAMASMLLSAVATVEARDTLAEDMAALADPPAAFGLDPARERVTVTYSDGSEITLVVGAKAGEGDTPFYFMRVEGRPELFALDVSTAEDLGMEAALLRVLPQPEIQQARISRISVRTAEGERSWALEGGIADPDTADRWFLETPLRYPADGEAMRTLRTNLTNLRLAGFAADDTPEARAAYGLDEPAAVITVEMDAGTTLVAGPNGAAVEKDWPAQTLVFTVGAARDEFVDYLLWDGCIATVSHFLVRGVTETRPLDTLSRYPVLTSLSNLARLTTETGGTRTCYEITRTTQTDENGETVTDETGRPVTVSAVTRDGEAMSWAAFEAAYGRLLLATVSGALPADFAGSEAQAHTRCVFETVTGVVHTLSLSDCDALHDAVWVDGCAAFYLVKGGLAFAPEE